MIAPSPRPRLQSARFWPDAGVSACELCPDALWPVAPSRNLRTGAGSFKPWPQRAARSGLVVGDPAVAIGFGQASHAYVDRP